MICFVDSLNLYALFCALLICLDGFDVMIVCNL